MTASDQAKPDVTWLLFVFVPPAALWQRPAEGQSVLTGARVYTVFFIVVLGCFKNIRKLLKE